MTYVILYDGFDTEGWVSIQKLFEPSFADDDVKIYIQSDSSRAMKIEDSMDRNMQHTFIFLSVQKPRRKGKDTSLIEKYRYKTLLNKIRKEFRYCEYHQNILCVIDRIPKNIGNGLYMEQEKETALSLDKFGYLDTTEETYFFTIDEVLHIKNEILSLIKYSEKITKELFDEKIENILSSAVDSKIEALKGKKGTGTRISSIKKMKDTFLEAFWQLELSSFERREQLISNTLKRVFSETIGILNSLNYLSILTYRPEQIHEEDSEMHITIASLISIIANRTENLLKKGWFEVSKIEIDKAYLGRSLKELYSIRLPEISDEKIDVTIHNLPQLNHNLVPFEDENISTAIEKIPWMYSSQKERGIKEKIDNIWKLLDKEIDKLSDNVHASRDSIYGHPGAKTDKVFTYNEIEEEANNPITIDYQDTDITKNQVKKRLENLSTDKIKGRFANYFDKLPSRGTYFLSLFVFFMIIFLITLIPVEVWTKRSLLIIDGTILVTMFLLSWIPIWNYRTKVVNFLSEYTEKINDIQRDAHKWHKIQIKSFKYSFETKLKYENRILFNEKLKEIESRKKKWKLHSNRVHELNKIAKDFASRLDIELYAEENWLPLSVIEQDTALIREYALFSQKKEVVQIVTDITKTDYNIECYGNIKNLEIQRIENGV